VTRSISALTRVCSGEEQRQEKNKEKSADMYTTLAEISAQLTTEVISTSGISRSALAITRAVGCIDWYGLLPVRSRHHLPW